MKFQGDIASIPITDVVQNLSANRKSGILTIELTDHTRQIIFSDGRITAYGDDGGFSIVRWFEEKGIIDEDIFKKAARRYKRAKKKSLCEILVQLGGMERDVYVGHIKDIVEEMLYETFSFREGIFEFDETEVDVESFDREMALTNLDLSVRSVMMEAARRMDDWESIRRSLPSENDIYQISSSDSYQLQEKHAADPVMLAAVKLLDGTRSIREVIAAIPAGKFSASRIVADLVSNKLARPVDGDELVKQLDESGGPEESTRALVRLKAALEREPGNQGLLLKVAELSLYDGKKEDSAVYYKLLAQSLFEEGKIEKAIKEIRTSVDLNPKDIGTWQKLYDFTDKSDNAKALVNVGLEMVQHLRNLGFNELARDHLAKMRKKFPDNIKLRLEHADTLFALGDRADAVKKLLDLARDLFQAGKQEDGETVLTRVIEYDPNHKRAKEIFDKVRTGKLEKQRARRLVLMRIATAVSVVLLIGAYIGYDLFARKEFAQATSEVFAEGLSDQFDYERAKKRLEEVRDRHPFSLLRFFEGREILRAIEKNIEASNAELEKEINSPEESPEGSE